MNERNDKLVYRKTEAGVTEVKSRKAGLDSRTRTLLILVNGALSVHELAQHLGHDPRPALETLAASGFVERVDATVRTPARTPIAHPAGASGVPAPTVTAPATSGVTATPPVAVAPPINLGPACQRAMQVLVPLYGPDAVAVVQPLLKARSLEHFHAALGELESKLSVPVGKKRAAEMVQQIRGASA